MKASDKLHVVIPIYYNNSSYNFTCCNCCCIFLVPMCTIADAKVQLYYNCYNVYFYECIHRIPLTYKKATATTNR